MATDYDYSGLWSLVAHKAMYGVCKPPLWRIDIQEGQRKISLMQ